MDTTKLLILSMGCISGFMVTSYQGIAEQKGWSVWRYFILERLGWIAVLGILCQYGCIIISFFVNPWWSSFIVLFAGFFGNMILTSIFKKYTQILALILVITSYILIVDIVFVDSQPKREINHFITSLKYANEVAKIANEGDPYTVLTEEEYSFVLDKSKTALSEAKKVDIDRLNSRLSGFGDHYEKEFIVGLELLIEGLEQNNNKKMVMGILYQNKWNKWYSHNFERIKQGE